MKKTLAALAVLGAFAGTSLAADVTLYGVLDYGLKYSRIDNDDGSSATNKFEMATGNQSGNRFGLKGSEDIGNGWKVGFNIENGFNSDAGTLAQNNRLFGRLAMLYVEGPYGTLIAGREGQLTSFNGTVGLTGGLTPFGDSWAGSPNFSTFFVGAARIDNSLTYKSPNFGGFQAYVQYSGDMNTKEDDTTRAGATATATRIDWKQTENKATANRYAALGLTYNAGPASLVLTADWYNWSSNYYGVTNYGPDIDDGYAVTFGGNYNFGVARAYAGVQYFDNIIKKSSTTDLTSTADTFANIGNGLDGQIKGYTGTIGVDAPVCGGTAMFAVGYNKSETVDAADDAESSRWGVGAGYTYSLSKRTNVYGVASYYQDKIEKDETTKPDQTVVVVGIRHRF